MNDFLKEHFLQTKNVGKIKKADITATWKSGFCGDTISITVKMSENGTISDIRHQCCGCWGLIASASVLTEYVKNKTPEEVCGLTDGDYLAMVGEIPSEKKECVLGPLRALRNVFSGESLQQKSS